MNPDDFLDSLALAIRAIGVDEDTADHWAALIGDTPEFSEDDQFIVVREQDGTEIARVPATVLG